MQEYKWFWAWQAEKEEAWLGEMSRKGWRLVSVKIPGIYTFSPDEPRDDIYRLDFRVLSKKDARTYLQRSDEAGWEHVAEMIGWQYFRKKTPSGETPEIFDNVESKVEMYRRLLRFLVVLVTPVFISSNLVFTAGPSFLVVKVLILMVLLLDIFALVKIGWKLRTLLAK